MTSNDYYQSCEILQISEPYTLNELKQSYRKMALKYHPDKCKDKSGDRFKEINTAYILLSTKFAEEENNTKGNYDSILSNFINYFHKNIDTTTVLNIINNITKKGNNYALKFFKDSDTDTCINIYEFFIKNRDVLHLKSELIDELTIIIREKIAKDNIVIINPSLDDLFKSNIFKLDYCNNIYYVPLWHSEIYYELNDTDTYTDTDLIVKCIPNLPEHIHIDENNNIHINLTYKTSISELLTKQHINYQIQDILKLDIKIHDLYIRPYQTIKFLNRGIPKICTDKIYNIDTKSHVIIHLELIY